MKTEEEEDEEKVPIKDEEDEDEEDDIFSKEAVVGQEDDNDDEQYEYMDGPETKVFVSGNNDDVARMSGEKLLGKRGRDSPTPSLERMKRQKEGLLSRRHLDKVYTTTVRSGLMKEQWRKRLLGLHKMVYHAVHTDSSTVSNKSWRRILKKKCDATVELTDEIYVQYRHAPQPPCPKNDHSSCNRCLPSDCPTVSIFCWPEHPSLITEDSVRLQVDDFSSYKEYPDQNTKWDVCFGNGCSMHDVLKEDYDGNAISSIVKMRSQLKQAHALSDGECNHDEAVTKDLLARCWSRALHAASSSVCTQDELSNTDHNLKMKERPKFFVPNGCGIIDDVFPTNFKYQNTSVEGEESKYSTKQTVNELEKRCKEHSLSWKEFVEGYGYRDDHGEESFEQAYCSFCGKELPTEVDARCHFFQHEKLVPKNDQFSEECALQINEILNLLDTLSIEKTLRREVKLVVDAILHVIMTDNRPKENNHVVDWKKLLFILHQSSAEDANVLITRTTMNLPTVVLPSSVYVDCRLPPIALNINTVRATAVRLIDRYRNN